MDIHTFISPLITIKLYIYISPLITTIDYSPYRLPIFLSEGNQFLSLGNPRLSGCQLPGAFETSYAAASASDLGWKTMSLPWKMGISHERSAKPQLKNAIFGSKLSFLGVHYIILQYILIASFASPGKLRAESLFTPPLQRLKHVWLPCAFFCSAPTVWYGMIPVNATANHSCTILSQTQKQVWIQLLEEVWMSSHSDMLHAFHSLPSVWVANHHHGPMLLPWLSSSRRKIAKPDLQVQVCRCARDEPGLTKAMERRKRICIAAKRS